MRRRSFLTLTGLGLAAAAGWSAHALRAGDDAAGDASLRRVIDEAAAVSKPVVVLLVPADDEHKRVRGHLFGALLQHGGDAFLADLSVARVVCATRAEVAAALGRPAPSAARHVLVLEHADGGVQAHAIATDVGDRPTFPPPGTLERDDEIEAVGLLLREWVRPLAGALRARLCGTEAIRAARAAAVRRGLGKAELAALAPVVAGKSEASAALLGRAAAVFVHADARKQVDEPRFRSRLAALSRRVLLERPPSGARWAVSRGCGTQVEGGPRSGIRCGMGHVPKPAQRFLWLFVEEG